MQWRGSYKIVQKVGNVEYKIEMEGKIKTFHANMMKRAVDRTYRVDFNRDIVGVAVIDVDGDSPMDENDLDDPPSHSTSEGPHDVNVSDELGENEKQDDITLLIF